MPTDGLRREAWDRLHELLRLADHGLGRMTPDQLEELGRLYQVAAADLAFLRTHQPDSVWVERLNSLLVRAYGQIYGERTASPARAWRFVSRAVPELLRAQCPFIALATGIYLAGFVAGFLAVFTGHAAALSPFLPSGLLAAGRHLHHTGGLHLPLVESPAMSSFIMTHNIEVSLAAFATGIALGLPTAYFMALNGLLLGALAAASESHGASLLFWSLILPHGVFELPATWIAGGAGFLLAAALIAPGDLSRREALALRGRQALGLLVAVLLLLVVAGLIEGFVTPSPLPPTVKLAVAVVGAALLVAYLFWPRRPFDEEVLP